MMIKVAFFDVKPYDKSSFIEGFKNTSDFDYVFYEERLQRKTVKLTEGMDAVCIFVNDKVNEDIIDTLISNEVKLIVLRCAGYNNVNLEYLAKRIPVVRVPSYSPYAVAEHGLALISALNRKTHKAYNRTREGNFSLVGLQGFDLNGKTAGIIGTGKIGQILIRILNALGMSILAFDLYPNEQAAKELNFKYANLEDLNKNADIISLHCPLTEHTRHIIDELAIAQMKKGVMIINTSRGELIKTSALIRGLKSGHIGSAGLDVYEEEENYFFEDHSVENLKDEQLSRLLSFNNVIITSHQAFLTNEALYNIANTSISNMQDFFIKNKLSNAVVWSKN